MPRVRFTEAQRTCRDGERGHGYRQGVVNDSGRRETVEEEWISPTSHGWQWREKGYEGRMDIAKESRIAMEGERLWRKN